ncbi:extracellular calcium-sensing receptor-like [Phyllobates terribilis]|uniref:extracellular calcium-sensing receptor-like n=1 Tax=Phyllobates terribilis TaxID=111132 RepID=UPI003CCAAE6D
MLVAWKCVCWDAYEITGILLPLRKWMISSLSSVSILSNRVMFPSFFRTVANDNLQCEGLTKLVLHFGWIWVGLLATDNDYGQQGILPIRKELIKSGVCVAFMEYIRLGQSDRNAPNIAKVIKRSTVKVIIVFSLWVDLVLIVDEMLKQDVKGKIFVANAGWAMSFILLSTNFGQILSGTIGLTIYNTVIPGYNEFLNKIHPSESLGNQWAILFWEKIFNCQFPNANSSISPVQSSVRICTGEEDFNNIKDSFNFTSSLQFSYTIHAAVQVAAKSLQDMGSCSMGLSPSGNCPDLWNIKQWQLIHYMKKVRLTLSNGNENYFDQNGDPAALYNIVNWQNLQGSMTQVKVGIYNGADPSGSVLSINSILLRWSMGDQQLPRSVCSESCPPGYRKAIIPGQLACCFECVQCLQGEISNQTDSIHCMKCPWDQWPNDEHSRCLPKSVEFLTFEDNLGKILAATSIMSSFIPLFILRLFSYYKQSPIVKANNYSVSCLLLLSLTLCFLCSIVFIGYPQPEKCLLRQAAFGMAFTLCVSCVLSKTIMVVFAFRATRPGSNLMRWTSPRVSYSIILICLLLQLTLCITFLAKFPPFPQYNTQSKPGVIIVECNEGSSFTLWIMLGYLFLLATISFIVAFLARRLPDSFNEAQFITFSMLAFLTVWISFIPASLSAQGIYVIAMEIFAILASSWALVICMFLPKCFIILFRPDMNSRNYLMRRERPGD